MKKNIKENTGGLDKDSSILNKGKNSYLFALNAVNSSEESGDFFLSSEHSNIECHNLPLDYVPLGHVYIGDKEEAILLINRKNSLCQIGILHQCKYTPHVIFNMGFKLSKQIDIIYRLRKGCEKVIYWVDDYNKPRFYNFQKPEFFKDSNYKNENDYLDIDKYWDLNKFNQDKEYDKIPDLQLEVLNNGGNLLPGSISVAIQYLDADFNPTHWITTTDFVNIYKSNLNDSYLNITGSINSDKDYYDFKKTSKSLKIDTTNLSNSFLFYRLAFIHKNDGTGEISKITFSNKISTKDNIFIYTGDNFEKKGTLEEIQTVKAIIKSANSIEQIDNMQILAGIKGSKVDYCKLQKFASKISSDAVLKKVYLNLPIDSNPKNPEVHLNGVGYQPGGIYSFGIVYIFKDNTESPVYHIPGDSGPSRNIWSPGIDVYPMDNGRGLKYLTSYRYTDNGLCTNEDYWGVNRRGEFLIGKPVRHHIFPLRTDLGIPLIEEVDSHEVVTLLKHIRIRGVGCITTPCSEQEVIDGICDLVADPKVIQIKVTYEVDGIIHYLEKEIDPYDYPNYGDDYCFTLTDKEWDSYVSPSFESSAITIIKVEEKQGSTWQDVTGGIQGNSGITYTVDVVNTSTSSTRKLYASHIFGIKFSNVVLPTIEEIGEEVIGYYIVRNERLETDKKILDSGVLLPTINNKKYISQGILGAEISETKINKKVFGLIHMQHKFNGSEFTSYDGILQQGQFNITDRKKSVSRYLDVLDGTSFDEERDSSGTIINKDKYTDYDGWSLKTITRDNIVKHSMVGDNYNILSEEIDNRFYLKSLESREILQGEKEIFNIAGDNKIGIITLKEENPSVLKDKFPYVYLTKDNQNSYSNFRQREYYKISTKLETEDTTIVFGGDTYLSPVRYVNTLFWDNRIAKRKKKQKLWKVVVGTLLLIVGVLTLAFGVGAVALYAGATLIGGSLLLTASGLEQALWNKAYGEEYDKGLRETLLDDWVNAEYKYTAYDSEPNKYGPEDDEIQWIGEAISDLWFESTINVDLRLSMTSQKTYLSAPSVIETGRGSGNEKTGKINVILSSNQDVWFTKDESLYPNTKLDKYIMSKLTNLDSKRKDNRVYVGHSYSEWYDKNNDYHSMNIGKIFFHLPIEYDCCSDCKENFPHRIMWSQISFQEELSDNYRVFLPNNYTDISGESGKITDIFKIKNNIYIHTEDALWHLQGNHQERVTDNIVSFIGTGEYFNIPPRKIVIGEHILGGCNHKWATITSPYGVFFISERDRKVYLFDGNSLKPISENKMKIWFEDFGNISISEEYKKLTGRIFKNDNNPSNQFGAGFISAYDKNLKRFILTKKDYEFSDEIKTYNDFELCLDGGEIILFPNFQQIIEDKQNQGFVYKGIENCKMKFEKFNYVSKEFKTYVKEEIENSKDVIVHLDISSSFGSSQVSKIINIAKQWVIDFRNNNPLWLGKIYFSKAVSSDWRSSQRTWSILTNIDTGNSIKGFPIMLNEDLTPADFNLISQDVLVVSFINENGNYANTGTTNAYYDVPTGNIAVSLIGSNMQDYTALQSDILDFKTRYNTRVNNGGSFKGLLFPVVFKQRAKTLSTRSTINYYQHVLAIVKGVEYTQDELDEIPVNSFLTSEDNYAIRNNLITNNPYNDDGLENYGWSISYNIGYDVNKGGDVISKKTFYEAMSELLKGNIGTIETIYTGHVLKREVSYVEGIKINEPYKNSLSWTLSFDIRTKKWISWHSYIPNFYFYDNDSFYSWLYQKSEIWTNNYIWNHLSHINKTLQKTFRTFYNTIYPFIVETVLANDVIKNKVWEDISLHTECLIYDPNTETYIKDRYETFNSLIAYNNRQCSGELILIPKKEDSNYLLSQIKNLELNKISIDYNEGVWNINDLRDIRVNYNVPIFSKKSEDIKNLYYIDKVLNTNSVSFDKKWEDLELFRGKYLIIRLIYTTLDNTKKLIFNFAVDTENTSYR